MTFVIALNCGVKVWDHTGAVRNHFHNVSETEITTMCFDARKRKLIIGNHDGEIVVLNYRNGERMKRFKSHDGHVSSLAYSLPDQSLISASWDRSIRIHDEIHAGEGSELVCPMLREIVHAHANDITAVAFSFELSLIATGSSDYSIRFWDFQFAKLEDGTRGICDRGHHAEITGIAFVEPYPLLVSADCTGEVCLWGVRPYGDRYGTPLHRFSNMSLRSEGAIYITREEKEAYEAKEAKDLKDEIYGINRTVTMRPSKSKQSKMAVAAGAGTGSGSDEPTSSGSSGSVASSADTFLTGVPGTEGGAPEEVHVLSEYVMVPITSIAIAYARPTERSSDEETKEKEAKEELEGKIDLEGKEGKEGSGRIEGVGLSDSSDSDSDSDSSNGQAARSDKKEALVIADRSRPMIVTGDYRGDIKLWGLSEAIARLGIEPLSADKLPSSAASYNPTRRVRRNYDGVTASGQQEVAAVDSDDEDDDHHSSCGRNRHGSRRRMQPRHSSVSSSQSTSRTGSLSSSISGGGRAHLASALNLDAPGAGGVGGSKGMSKSQSAAHMGRGRASLAPMRAGGTRARRNWGRAKDVLVVDEDESLDGGSGAGSSATSSIVEAQKRPGGQRVSVSLAVEKAAIQKIQDITVIEKWRAHTKSIIQIEVINVINEPFSLLTTSFDMSVRVWGMDGSALGVLVVGEEERAAIAQGAKDHVPWLFQVDVAKRARKERRDAEDLLEDIQRAKMMRRQSMVRRQSVQMERDMFSRPSPPASPMATPSSPGGGGFVFDRGFSFKAGGAVQVSDEHYDDDADDAAVPESHALAALRQLVPEDNYSEAAESVGAVSLFSGIGRTSMDSVYRPPKKEDVYIPPSPKYMHLSKEAIRNDYSREFDVDTAPSPFIRDRLGLGASGLIPRRHNELHDLIKRRPRPNTGESSNSDLYGRPGTAGSQGPRGGAEHSITMLRAASRESTPGLLPGAGLTGLQGPLMGLTSGGLSGFGGSMPDLSIPRSGDEGGDSQFLSRMDLILAPSGSRRSTKSWLQGTLAPATLPGGSGGDRDGGGMDLDGGMDESERLMQKRATLERARQRTSKFDLLMQEEDSVEKKRLEEVRRRKSANDWTKKGSKGSKQAKGGAIKSRKSLVDRTREIASTTEANSRNPEGDRVRNQKAARRARQKEKDAKSGRKDNTKRGKYQTFGPYMAKDVLMLKRMFDKLDIDGGGSIDMDEFMSSEWMNTGHMFENAATMFEYMDKDMSGTIELRELMEASFPLASKREIRRMLEYLERPHLPTEIADQSLSDEQLAELQAIFDVLDTDHSGDLTVGEIFDIIGEMNADDEHGGSSQQAAVSMEELQVFADKYDTDGNSTIDIDEFIALLKDTHCTRISSSISRGITL